MSRETWATFSVNDHCDEYAFVREVMLYDRLVIPIPSDATEQSRWEKERWKPNLLADLIKVLGDKARPVEWNVNRQKAWKTRFDAGTYVAIDTQDWAFQATRTELTKELPNYVKGVEAFTRYSSFPELSEDLALRKIDPNSPIPGGASTAILGHEFLGLDTENRGHMDVLAEAVDLSSQTAFRRRRRAYWRWQREFLGEIAVTDMESLRSAIEEMRDLVADERRAIRRKRVRTTATYVFFVSSLAFTLAAGGPLTPIAIGGAFASLGQFAVGRLAESDENRSAAAVFVDTKKHFGWK